MRKLAVAILAASVGMSSCDRLVDPPLPADAERFDPPAVFSTWWQMTEACSGLTGSLHAVSWFKTNDIIRHPQTGEQLVGYWSAASNRILLSESVMRAGGAVRHEMLHALVRKPGHSRSQFLGKCAGTVTCASDCVEEAGPYPIPPEGPIEVGDASIAITVKIEPANPTRAHDDGFFAIIVAARNLSTHWATIPPINPIQDPMDTFRFVVQGSSAGGSLTGGERALDPSATIFAPGETKRQVFDFAIGDAPFDRQLIADDYTVRGGYSDHWSAPVSFTIPPKQGAAALRRR